MKSRRYKWQTRWTYDAGAKLATHADGLQVSMASGQAQAVNAAAYTEAMTPKHGGHNVPRMLGRLLWEATELYGRDAP